MIITLASCSQKKLYIESLPPNTPKGAQIFVAGNFNNWNPGDPNYILKYDAEENKYWVSLPMGFGNVEYKFTRGDWTTTETDSCGGDFGNKILSTSLTEDWIGNSIVSWHDLDPINCSRMVLVIDSLPINSPPSSPIFLIGNINDWTLGSKAYQFNKAMNGKYYLTVFKKTNKLEFKLNRGFNETVEANELGREVDTRILEFGKKDTIHISIKSWVDMPIKNHIKHTFIIDNIPPSTPKNSCIYLVGEFNGWNPFDKNLLFNPIANNKYSLTIHFKELKNYQFKITRGGWDFEETDNQFNPMPNRLTNLLKNDTTYISIQNWFDKAPNYNTFIKKRASNLEIKLPKIFELFQPEPKEIPEKIEIKDNSRRIVFILTVPYYTSNYDKIFLTGDFNNWNPKDERFLFSKVQNGKYKYILKLKDMNAHEFKITNGGNWDNEEANTQFEKLNNKKIACCKLTDTINLSIANWQNYTTKRKVVFIIDDYPKGANDEIYLTGNFNNWNVKDEDYRFENYGATKKILYLYHYDKNYKEFKITKGSWDTEFTDIKNKIYENKNFENYLKNDTIRFNILNWKN